MSFDLFPYLASLCIIYIYCRLAIHYLPFTFKYFLGTNFKFIQTIEKPRILFHILGLSFMHLMLEYHQIDQYNNIIIEIITYITFTIGFYICILSWGERFLSTFSTRVKTQAIDSTFNFNIIAPKQYLLKLFNEMVRNELIIQEKTSFKDFYAVLTNDWNSHESKIYLNLDGPSCREFYDNFIQAFPNNSLTLKKFFIQSGKVFRPDGKKYNYNTIKNALTRTQSSKKSQVIDTIFRTLNS